MPSAILKVTMTMTKTSSNLSKENVVEILMNIPAYKKGYSFLFVEGRDDRHFWNRFSVDKCDVFTAGDQERVIETLTKKHIRRDLRQRIAGIVDADYELIDPTGELLVEDLMHDDVPDLENMIVSRKTIASVMIKPGPFKELANAENFAKNWLDAGMKLAIDYGYFRLVARQNRKFGLFPNWIEESYGSCIQPESLRLNLKTTAEKMIDGSPRVKVSADELLAGVRGVEAKFERSCLLVRGKDLLNFMLCISLPVFDMTDGDESVRRRLEDWLRVVRDSGELFRRLQSKYQCEDLKQTKIHGRIKKWENTNSPYKILKTDI